MHNINFENFANSIEGFTFFMFEDYFEFSKNVNSVKYVFGGNLRQYQHNVICDHLNAGISFEELESFLTPILINSGIFGKHTNAEEQWTLKVSNNHLLGKSKIYLEDYKGFSINESNINEFQRKVVNTYNNSIKLFFSEWKNISDFVVPVENLQISQCTDIFGDGGIFKKAYILRKFNKEKSYNFLDLVLKNFETAKKNNPEEILFDRYYNATILMKEELSRVFNDRIL